MSNAPEVRRADQSMSQDATLKTLQEGYSPRSTAVFHAHAKNRPRPLWVDTVEKGFFEVDRIVSGRSGIREWLLWRNDNSACMFSGN